MVKVLVDENNVEKALRKIKKKAMKEGFWQEQRRRQRYLKKNVVKQMTKKQQVRDEKKRVRILEKVWGF